MHLNQKYACFKNEFTKMITDVNLRSSIKCSFKKNELLEMEILQQTANRQLNKTDFQLLIVYIKSLLKCFKVIKSKNYASFYIVWLDIKNELLLCILQNAHT